MRIFFIILFSLFGINYSSAQWRVDFSNPEMVIVRHDLYYKNENKLAIIAFEYQRRCDPVFSIIKFYKSYNSFSGFLNKSKIEPGIINIIIDGTAHTWYGAKINYQTAYEIGLGLENNVFNKLRKNPSNIVWNAIGEDSINIPTTGLSQQIEQAIMYCAKKIGL